MLTPEYLQGLPEKLVSMTTDLEKHLIDDISRRVAKTGKITDTAAYQLMRLKELGASTKYIKSLLADYTKRSEAQIEELILNAAQTDSEFYGELYGNANMEYVPYEYNGYLQQLTVSAVDQTNGELKNLTQSMGFAVRGLDGQLKFTSAAETYQTAMDKAHMLVASGGADYITAARTAVRDLTASGLRFVDYASGVKHHADVAVRRALLTGVSQMTGQIAEHNADELDTDVVEVDAHSGARPDHAEWQGRWYSLHGRDKRYPLLADATGYGTVTGLKGANCRHDFYPVIPGISVPTYTEDELKNIDPPPVTVDGRTYTCYEATQRQRDMERAIRKTKREIIAAQALGDEEMFAAKSVLLKRQRNQYADFSKRAGLLTESERTQVYGFGYSQASKAVWAERKARNGTGGSSAPTAPKGSGGHSVEVNVPTPNVQGNTKNVYTGVDISGGSGIIEEREYEFGIAYGKYSVNADMDYIKSDEYSKIFDYITNNHAVNKALLDCARSAIKHRNGTKFEDMYFIHAETGEILAKQVEMTFESGISYNDEIKALLKRSKKENIPLITLHNHPEGYPPSIDDFNKSFENNTVFGIAVGHNGQLYRYENHYKAFTEQEMMDIHNEIVYNHTILGMDIDRAYQDVFKNNGINYTLIKEGMTL